MNHTFYSIILWKFEGAPFFLDPNSFMYLFWGPKLDYSSIPFLWSELDHTNFLFFVDRNQSYFVNLGNIILRETYPYKPNEVVPHSFEGAHLFNRMRSSPIVLRGQAFITDEVMPRSFEGACLFHQMRSSHIVLRDKSL